MGKKGPNKKFLLGIAVAVLVPLFCYLVTNQFSKGAVKMPRYYVVEKVDSVVEKGKPAGDTIYHRTSDLVLTNQLGKRVSLDSDLKGKILVVGFFFTNCPSICPRLTGTMKLLQNGFKKDTKKETQLDTVMQLISITVNPERDTFPVMRAYADRFGVNHDHWWFLTGDKKAIYNFARNDLQLTVGPGDGGADDFIHTEMITLIDKDRYVRGYYNGLDSNDVNKCAEDIVLLTQEWKHKK